MPVKKCLTRQRPVIAVGTKKPELVGLYKNPGQAWRNTGNPRHVNLHDFPDQQLGKAVPSGVYDMGQTVGWVNVGCDNDPASFALESIRRWWVPMGQPLYPKTRTLLLCADSGGSHGDRGRWWKRELQRRAHSLGLEVTVCHFPAGPSKWHKIDHRLCAHLSMTWRGQPWISHEVIVELIGTTTTTGGLHGDAQLDTHTYPTKITVSDEERATRNLQPHALHGAWNYTVKPRRP